MKTKLLASLVGLSLLAFFSGCASVAKYPPSVDWNANVRKLGTVTADSGKWPLALNAPPPEYTYTAALKAKAAEQFHIPERDVVLGEVSVKYMAEVVGTIRSWEATAEAGQLVNRPEASASTALMDLKKLLDAGAITQSEYDAKKKVLLEKL